MGALTALLALPSVETVVGWIVKATVLLAMAAIGAALMRRRSAAERSALWVIALSALAVLPLVSVAAPRWSLFGGDLPEWTDPILAPGEAASETPLTPATDARPGAEGDEGLDAGAVWPAEARVTRQSEPTGADGGEPFEIPARGVVFLIWVVGAGALGLRMGSSWRHLATLRRGAGPFDDPRIGEIARRSRGVLGMRRPVTLLSHPEVAVPVTFGFRDPVIVLPEEASGWDTRRLERALLHELGHVRRSDWLFVWLSEFVTALYWFHPGAWVASRKLRASSEEACDDVVLLAGASPEAYADDMIASAKALNRHRRKAAGALAMARESTLEGRILGILDRGRVRRRLRPAMTSAAAGIGLFVTASIAGATISAGAAPGQTPALRLELRTTIEGSVIPFGKIGGVVADGDGRIYVADVHETAQEILIFDSVDNRVGTLGGQGEGPGEFERMRSTLAWKGGDTLVALDARKRYATLFAPTGDRLMPRTRNLLSAGEGTGVTAARLLAAGPELYLLEVRSPMRIINVSELDGPLDPLTVGHYLRFLPGGSVEPLPALEEDSVHAIGAGMWSTGFHCRIGGWFPVVPRPFTARGPRRAFLPSGELARADAEAYRIDIVDPGSGEVVRSIQRDVPRYPLTDEDWEGLPAIRELRIAEALEDRGKLEVMGDPGTPCPIYDLRPEHHPALRTLVSDDAGRLWVEATSEDGFTLALFGPDGDFLGETPMPDRDPAVTPFVRDDRLYIATVDDLGVQGIEVYEVLIGR